MEILGKFQSLRKDRLLVNNYIVCGKTLSNHLAASGEIISKRRIGTI